MFKSLFIATVLVFSFSACLHNPIYDGNDQRSKKQKKQKKQKMQNKKHSKMQCNKNHCKKH